MTDDIYDRDAERYDAWYDASAGRAILADELAALAPLLAEAPRPWLEIGAGTGRFTSALGVDLGIDPALHALAVAARRRTPVAGGRGEALPGRTGVFGAVVIVTALSFVEDPPAVLNEARRVLRPDGRLIIGEVPADGPWGQHYRALAEHGHAYYRLARFLTRSDLHALLAAAGFRPVRSRAALIWPPGDAAGAEPVRATAREGDDPAAGFLALAAVPEGG